MLFVGVGGIFGALSRYLLGKWIASKVASSFPFGTWIINISGSFFLGFLAVLHLEHTIPEWLWLILGTGFLGAYTTFSTFGYETIQLLKKRDGRAAIVYVLLSVIFGAIFAWMGSVVGKTAV